MKLTTITAVEVFSLDTNEMNTNANSNYSLMVSVTLVTYNQEDYIRQAIESILKQDTEYSYEIIIGEDNSSDSTQIICQEYAERHNNIRLLSRENNLGVTMNWVDCVRHSRGKYIMMLDGDDFWQNQNKIQMQVDFMENHPECVICHTEFDFLREKTGLLVKSSNKVSGVVVPEGMIQKEVISGREKIVSSSMCLRSDSINNYIPFDIYKKEAFPCEDWPTIVILSAYGEIRYLPISTTTYRCGQESVTNTHDYEKIRKYWTQSKNMTYVMHQLFPNELGEFIDEWYFDNHMYNALMNAAYENGDYRLAKSFSKQNPANRLANHCTRTWLTFQLFRLYRIIK